MIRLADTGSVSASMPNTEIEPASGRSRPATMRSVVVLPAPFGPSSAIELAGAHREIETVDGGPVEDFLQAADFERGERLELVHGGRVPMAGRQPS